MNADTLERQLYEAWNQQLYRWWHDYNNEYLSQALKVPIIRLGDAELELGNWLASTRTLTISTAHIERDPWLAVMQTLRHEMAHQYVGEILMVTNESPHGPAFRTACQKLRCSPRASGTGRHSSDPLSSLPNGGQPQLKILQTLKKVLSLAASPNEHEAQAAVRKARYLLIKYNIDLVELNEQRRFDTRCLGEVKGRHASYEHWLASILNSFFFVEILWTHSYNAQRKKPGRVLQIYGTEENLDMAEYVYSYLLNLLDRMWESYRSNGRRRVRQNRQHYFEGVLEGFFRKLQTQDQTFHDIHALVWKGDAQLRSYYRYLNPRIRTQSFGGGRRSQTYVDGLKEGHTVTIHKPVSDQGTGLGGYLMA